MFDSSTTARKAALAIVLAAKTSAQTAARVGVGAYLFEERRVRRVDRVERLLVAHSEHRFKSRAGFGTYFELRTVRIRLR